MLHFVQHPQEALVVVLPRPPSASTRLPTVLVNCEDTLFGLLYWLLEIWLWVMNKVDLEKLQTNISRGLVVHNTVCDTTYQWLKIRLWVMNKVDLEKLKTNISGDPVVHSMVCYTTSIHYMKNTYGCRQKLCRKKRSHMDKCFSWTNK